MARTPEASSDTPTITAAAVPLSAAAHPHRVTKTRTNRASSRTTSYSSRSIEHMRNMVNDAHSADVHESCNLNITIASSTARGKGKATAVPELAATAQDLDMDTPPDVRAETETYNADKPFPIMELPTEIRLEIYRACLTRPYNILLSKREQPQQPESEDSEKTNALSDSQSDDDTDDDSVPTAVPRPTTSGSSTSLRRTTVPRQPPSRSSRPIRLLSSRSTVGSSASNGNIVQVNPPTTAGASAANTGTIFRSAASRPPRRNGTASRTVISTVTEPPRNQSEDPLIVNILQASKEIYKEARSILYSENFFTLDLNTAMSTLACLHQRSRRQIKHVELEIPTYNEILERFQETVRLSLRYCSGLKKFVVDMPFTLPGADGSGTTGNTTVYANGFDILRWLPQECDIVLKGNICIEIETVVNKHLLLAKTLDKVSCVQ